LVLAKDAAAVVLPPLSQDEARWEAVPMAAAAATTPNSFEVMAEGGFERTALPNETLQ
jgi:hypothetical protein